MGRTQRFDGAGKFDSRVPSRLRRLSATLAAGAVIGAGALVMGALPGGAVVGGTPTTGSAHPWQVSLQSGGHICGGSIVDSTTIVTAAHCTEGLSAGDLSVRAGVTNHSDAGGQDRPVAQILNHPDYARTGTSDIAVIKLAQPLTLGSGVQAIGLATSADVAQATTGWGATFEMDEQGSRQLLEAQVPLVGDAACDSALGGDQIDTRTELCAGGTGTDSCYGDSGGPLVVTGTDGQPKLAGVTSWGIECGGAAPGVYAEVPAFAEWVNGGGSDGVAPAPSQPDLDLQPGEREDEISADADLEWEDSDWLDGDEMEWDDDWEDWEDWEDDLFDEFDDLDPDLDWDELDWGDEHCDVLD